MTKTNNYNLPKILFAVILLALFAWKTMTRDIQAPSNPAWTGMTMGSTYSIKLVNSPLFKKQLDFLKKQIEDRLEAINTQLSTYRPDSEISRFNQSSSSEAFAVSPTFHKACAFALALSRQTDGIFDPTLDPLINLWGFGHKPKPSTPPSEEEINQARSITGYQHLSVQDNGTIRKDIPGLQLNLNAFVPGLAADEVAKLIRTAGITNLYVEIGGEVVAFGHNAQGGPWKIGIEKPDSSILPGESLEGVVQLCDQAIATSGNYRSFFTNAEGQVFSHILDPKTGRPVKHRLASVSVLAGTCMAADALATALFAMGPDQGMKWVRHHPEIDALFVVRNEDGSFSEIPSPGFSNKTGYTPATN